MALKFKRGAYYSTIVSLLLLASGLTVFATGAWNGRRLFSIESNSMAPVIKTGDLILTKPEKEYHPNEIITFKKPGTESSRKLVTSTHRISKVVQVERLTYYQTKGDANQAVDPDLRPQNAIVGKVISILPKVGYLIDWLRSLPGRLLLILISSSIALSEGRSIYRELTRRRLKTTPGQTD